jgi:hypothetical protein
MGLNRPRGGYIGDEATESVLEGRIAMHWDGWGMHWNGWEVHWSMMILMALFWIAVIVGLAFLVARIVQPGGPRATAGGPRLRKIR